MEAFKFCKIDLIRSKSVIFLSTLLMVGFATYFIVDEQGLGFVVGYLAVIAVIVAILPFNLEQRYESGFIDMLPGTTSQRVHGRYFYGAMMMVLCSLLGLGSLMLYIRLGNKLEDYFGAVYLALVSVVILAITIEYVIFYAVGRGKIQKLLPIFQILLPMVLLFGAASIGEYLETNTKIDLTWLLDNKYPISITAFLVTVLLYIVTSQVSIQICKRRDYA
ncbi:MAG: ABC-2 transporter permease [bacterium]|nr:ABC-2 transporter permease [bacterium]